MEEPLAPVSVLTRGLADDQKMPLTHSSYPTGYSKSKATSFRIQTFKSEAFLTNFWEYSQMLLSFLDH